jgi:hypothetical protein
MKYFLAIFTFLLQQFGHAQLTEDFSDNNITSNPTWSGDDSVFTLLDIAGDLQLRSNKTIASSSFYLTSPSTQVAGGQWEFYTYLNFNTSSANFTDIYLTSNQANLLNTTISGYFIRIGGTTDEISLYRKIAGVSTKIIDGTDGITNTSNNYLKLKVTCSPTYEWKLERDISGSGNTFFTEGIITDATIPASSFFGISITQSTASFFQKHYFDDFYVGPILYDIVPPVLLTATAVSASQIDILFNEALNPITAEDETLYDIQPFLSATSAVLDANNPALVHLTTTFPLVNGNIYTVFAYNIEDLALNSAAVQSLTFTYLIAENPLPGEVIITEFICDESPSVGLPLVEYIEIFNTSFKYFNLDGWKLGDNSSDGTIQSKWLYPGEYLVLCSSTKIDSFLVAAAVTSFPSLNNSGDDIVLKDLNGIVLDKISYTDNWYQDASKENGGYSIELINPNDPCSDASNWRASIAAIGGTPGLENSVKDLSPDTLAPTILQLLPQSPNYLTVTFSEGMDSTFLANASVSFSPSLTLANTFISNPFPTSVTYQFSENLIGSQMYSLLLENISDCWMNTANLSGNFALPEIAVAGDLVINEILFDPYTGGYDWIEVYNTSTKLLDLYLWEIGNYDDSIANKKAILQHYYVSPKEYAVIGKDSIFVKQNYPAAIPGTFVYCELPTFTNDSSTVYLVYDAAIIDKVSYSDDWHFKLLDNTDGVSLEKIDPSGLSDDSNNWHSAAEAIGFATPGGKNSQYLPALLSGEFTFASQIISPDNDGNEDFLQITYAMSESGLLGKFTIFDDRGREVRTLFSNELLASSGTFTWDGISDQGVKAKIGTHVAVFEAFSTNGALIYTKTKAFVVAGKI